MRPVHSSDEIWLDCARKLELPVERGGDGYVHFDGRVLRIAADRELDADDSLAQLILHELCHSLVEGPARRFVADWGLDNTHDGDILREHAALRLQAHLATAFGLRDHLPPTTVVRPYYDGLPREALGAAGDPDPAVTLARAAAERAGRWPYDPTIFDALDATARAFGVARHPSGLALGDGSQRCGSCVWRTPGGLCRRAERRVRVAATEPACARFEAELDCLDCGACCRSAYDTVVVGARDPFLRAHPSLVVVRGELREVARTGDRCTALDGPPTGPFACRVYDDRPRTCRNFERAGRHCLTARARVGLSV
jgi:hypothetical protein